MKRLLLLLFSLLLVIVVACQAPTSQIAVTETSQSTPTPAQTAEVDVPQIAVTETLSAVEPAADAPTPIAPAEEISTSAVASANGFDYLVDAYYDESSGWQLRGVRRTAVGDWETALVPLGEPVSVGGVDHVPGNHGALIWDHSGSQGAGPSNLSAGPLYLVDLGSGSVETLVPDNVVTARWLPDGQGYSYLLATEETYELHVLDATGDDRIVALDVPRDFTFSPDGSAVAFTRESGYGLPGKPGIYVVDITTGYQGMPSDVDRAGTGAADSGWAPLWSPDGASLLLRAYAGGSDPGLIWAARDGSWSHTLVLEDLDSAAGAALGQENVCTNQEFLPIGPTTLLAGAGPCSAEPLMGAMAEATHLVLLELDPVQGTLTPAGTIPAPVATFFFLGYQQQSNSVVLHSPTDPVSSAIYEVMLPSGPTEAESERDGANASDALCPEVPRPALGLFIPDEGYLIADPVSGAECATTLDGAVRGHFQASGDALYYTVQEDEQFVVKRLGQNGEASPLSFTAVERDDALLYHGFVVSPHGSRIAWSTTTAGPDAASPPTSTIWVANTDGNDIVNVLPEFEAEGVDGRIRVLVPLRFSKDGSTLFYTLQVETGGIWSAFVGHYDSLYALHLNADAQPTQIFDCPGSYTMTRMCIGDFYEVQGQVEALAYVDGQALFIVDGMGNVRNTIEFEVDYLGYPAFGPKGDLVVYSAEGAASVTPEEGTIYYVAAPLVQSAAPEVLAVDTRLLRPRGWLDAGHVVTGYVTGDNGGSVEWGTAVVRLDGSIQVIELEPTADFIDVLPAPGGTTSPSG